MAERVLREGAAVVTFNYDTLLERAMIAESGGAPWDPIPAYGAPFDGFEPRGGGPIAEYRFARFPAQAHAAPFLKLHGSLNWFRQAGGPGGEHGGTLIRPVDTPLVRPAAGNTFVMPDGALLEQLIITPVLNKDVDREPFAHLWRRAREEMWWCKRLVVGGYSFPPTDFATRRLFLESFVGGPPAELVVINPDANAVREAKHLCHFRGPVAVCSNLREYTAR